MSLENYTSLWLTSGQSSAFYGDDSYFRCETTARLMQQPSNVKDRRRISRFSYMQNQ